jgi:hypothetical protein
MVGKGGGGQGATMRCSVPYLILESLRSLDYATEKYVKKLIGDFGKRKAIEVAQIVKAADCSLRYLTWRVWSARAGRVVALCAGVRLTGRAIPCGKYGCFGTPF